MSPLQGLIADKPQKGVCGHGGITVRVLQSGIIWLDEVLCVEPLDSVYSPFNPSNHAAS